MSEENRDLNRSIASALERISEAMRVQLGEKARENGLSPTQLQVILRLAADPPALRRVGAIAARLDVTHPTVSDAVAALRRKGLVAPHSPGRRQALSLSSEGLDLAGRLEDWPDPTRAQLASLRAEGKEAALEVLLETIAGLQRSGAISVSRMCSTCRHFRPEAHPGEPQQHHCALLDQPLANQDIRLDCPEYEQKAA